MPQIVLRHCPPGISIDPQLFLKKFKATIKHTQSYIRPCLMQSLYREGIFSKEESLVFRIMVRKFVFEEFPVWLA
jgi:hypothetical protein